MFSEFRRKGILTDFVKGLKNDDVSFWQRRDIAKLSLWLKEFSGGTGDKPVI